ncbi:MAG: preprotein translocase subunit SecG [Candidatus Yanofskybacteria bacterium CG10_big_fil_rev_8_21_14_0_10_36_16]|uniref:Protein-export membrane protein SecG n=1 Tax=Candidatus Yanofskybacteria bacterium CG10_big_fil_rev_8_21_14_0_10_36_16 TaxID=1975096 RepID=A0A2J0Q7T5_9BACT|nr:MAG: preprotein translocase subunit SecG [Candidatus Yanofskybacteria bacterium CG10_big_fil_rev_8_21_14_0_10_36_16]
MDIIAIIQIVLSVLLVVVILLQQRGSGLGGAFGGDSSAYSTKRGLEKVLYSATIVLAILFFAISVTRLFL